MEKYPLNNAQLIKSQDKNGNFYKTQSLSKSAKTIKKRGIQSDEMVKGASIIAIGGLISKLLGALYRIPLTTILGAEGLAVYQTVFPIYCILLTFSSTGVPTAIAKLVSSGYGEKVVLTKSLSVFVPLGFLGSLLMILLSLPLASMQGNSSATLAYVTLAPSVVTVSVISCIRGYFQGKMNMVPTAVSQVIEQVIKLSVGLLLCLSIKGSPAVLGALACLAVTVSEIVALLYLYATYKRGGLPRVSTYILSFKRLIATLLPIVLSSLLLPIARTFDSFTIVNYLKKYTLDASSLYGIYTGSVESVSGVPVAICYGLAVAVLPSISRRFSQKDLLGVKDNLLKSFSLTLFASTLLGLGLYIFAPLITNILFSTLSPYLSFITAKLISLSFFTVIGLSLVQTLTSCLVALGKPYAPCISLLIGLLVKSILQINLLKVPSINIFASLYSDIACYFVAVFLNLLYIITIFKTKRVYGK